MHWFSSTSKVVSRLATRHNISKQCIKYSKNSSDIMNDHIQIRRLSSVAGIKSDSFNSNGFSDRKSVAEFSGLEGIRVVKKRGFFGSGDDGEGDVLSKVYQEKRLLGYSPEQLFAVVSGVDLYEDFVPWCQRSKILRHFADGSLDAELLIGFNFLVESYIANMFFKEVVSRLVSSFDERCRLIYGPGVPLEKSYHQRA